MSKNKKFNFLPSCIVIDVRSNIIVFSSDYEVDVLRFADKSVFYRAYRLFGWFSDTVK